VILFGQVIAIVAIIMARSVVKALARAKAG